MANEATISELYGENGNGDIRRYTISSALAIAKGALLQGSDPHTASLAQNWSLGSSATSGAFVGIAVSEKVAGDADTEIGVYTNGVFELKASGAITSFHPVYCAGNNEVKAITAAIASQALVVGLLDTMMVGIAQETATDGETIRVRVFK